MRAYLLVTGTVFGLVVVAHVWRAIAESHQLVRDPGFIALTLVAAGLSAWAFTLARRRS